MIRYPNIIGKTDAQKLDQMKSYLHQLVDELNFRLEKSSNNSNDTVQATTRPNSTASTKSDDAISSFNEIKGLIIKSADIVNSYSEQISKTLKGEYVAVSDFGTYTQDTLAELEISADAIKNTLTKVESIDEDIKKEVQSEVKQTAESISLSVDNGETTAQIVLKVGDREIPATIDMKGLVTFSNLLTSDGTTQINGDNIITGKIMSKDGESLIIDLDAGNVDLTGRIKTEIEFNNGRESQSYISPARVTVESKSETGSEIGQLGSDGLYIGDANNAIALQISEEAIEGIPYGAFLQLTDKKNASTGSIGFVEAMANPDIASLYVSLAGNYLSVSADSTRSVITGLTAPVDSADAANKKYVDDGLADKVFFTDSGNANFRNGLQYSGSPTKPLYMAVWDADDSATGTQPNRRVRSIEAADARALMGAAPSGYGYGGQAVALKGGSRITSEEELNTELAKVYDSMESGETKMLTCIGYPSPSDWRWFGILTRSSANNGSFVAQGAYNGGSQFMKTKNSGAWKPCVIWNAGMGIEFDTGAINVASGSTWPYNGNASKFYNVTVQIGSTAYRHTFVVDWAAVNSASNKQIGYYSDAMGKQLNLVVKIDGTSISFKPSGCNIVHIRGYY